MTPNLRANRSVPQRERVLASLSASSAHDIGGPLSRHISEVEFLRVAVRWFVAIQRDREEHGPLRATEAPVYRPEAS